MIYMFLAPGFEEIEAIATIDVLKRAGVDVKTVGVENEYVSGSHGITIKSDTTVLSMDDIEAIILPGGMPGTLNLKKSPLVNTAIDFCIENDLYIFAICAAPSILGSKGLLKNKYAVCFPGFEDQLLEAKLSSLPVCQDGNIITAKGPGVVFDFALKIVDIFKSKQISAKIKSSMQCT